MGGEGKKENDQIHGACHQQDRRIRSPRTSLHHSDTNLTTIRSPIAFIRNQETSFRFLHSGEHEVNYTKWQKNSWYRLIRASLSSTIGMIGGKRPHPYFSLGRKREEQNVHILIFWGFLRDWFLSSLYLSPEKKQVVRLAASENKGQHTTVCSSKNRHQMELQYCGSVILPESLQYCEQTPERAFEQKRSNFFNQITHTQAQREYIPPKALKIS